MHTACLEREQLAFLSEDELSQRLLTSKPSDSDREIATRLADYLLCTPGYSGRFYLFILDDRRTVPLPFTQRYKNCFCFTTMEREAAKGWIIDAALRGYSVMRGFRLRCPLGGMGTIGEIRKRCHDR